MEEFNIDENKDQFRSTNFDCGEELIEHLSLESYCEKLILFMPGPQKSSEVVRMICGEGKA